MAFYFGGKRLGDTYEDAEKVFFDECLEDCKADFVEDIIENIEPSVLIEWCLNNEGFCETFADAITKAKDAVAQWWIEEVDEDE